MQKPTKLAFIGAGRWGKNIVRTLKTLPECTLLYRETRNYPVLLEKKSIDAVIVATPASTHARIALPFIKKGIPSIY